MRLLLANIIGYGVYALQTIIFIRVLISWLAPYSRNDFTDIIYAITEPILRPFRFNLSIGNGRMDLSPILAYIALNVIRKVLFFLLF